MVNHIQHLLKTTGKIGCILSYLDSKELLTNCIFVTGTFGGLTPNDPQMIFYLDRYEPQTVSTQQPGTQKLKKIIMGLQGLYRGQRRPTSNHTFTPSPSFLICMLHIN
jgi:hypothetical protein